MKSAYTRLEFFCFLFFLLLAAKGSTGQDIPQKLLFRIVDSINHKAVPNATITLTDSIGQKILKRATSNASGEVSLEIGDKKNLRLTIEVANYKVYTITNFKELISDHLLEVLLVRKEITLENVLVSGTKKIIENKLDKLVYNAEKDITSQGGTTADLLKKIPGVTVDIDGNVELLGNPSVKFLVDGKPSGIFGNNIADALQSIPASQIQSIEVITSPGAKYDASGTGGIVNIILKKNKLEGFNGNLSLAAGSRLENGSLNAGWKKGKVSLNGYFGGNAQLRSATPLTLDRKSYNNTGTIISGLLQQSKLFTKRNSYKSGLAADWSLSKTETINISFDFSQMTNKGEGITNQFFTTYDSIGNSISRKYSIRPGRSSFSGKSIENSISYKKSLNDKGREVSLSYNGSYTHNNTYYDQFQQNTLDNSIIGGSQSLNPGIENEIEFSIDYLEPIKKKTILETGIKATKTNIFSDADVLTLNPGGSEYYHDSSQSYRSNYHRWVLAGYLSISMPLTKEINIKAGLRIEHTDNQGYYSNSGKISLHSYNNFAPSIVALHSFNNQSSLKFAYSYRLERPDFRDLNPFMNLSDPHNITTGNPFLNAEIGHNFELSYLKNFKSGASLSIVANNQKNSPDIKPYTSFYSTIRIGDSLYSDVTITTRDNIAAEIRRGINITISVPAGKKLSTRMNLMIFNRHLKNFKADPVITDALGCRINMTGTLQVTRTLTAEAYGNFNLGMHWQGRQASLFSYTLAFRKQFLKNRASFGFVTTTPFNKYVNQRSVQEAPGFTSNNFRQVPYRSFGLYISWKFGKLKFKPLKESENYLYSVPSEN